MAVIAGGLCTCLSRPSGIYLPKFLAAKNFRNKNTPLANGLLQWECVWEHILTRQQKFKRRPAVSSEMGTRDSAVFSSSGGNGEEMWCWPLSCGKMCGSDWCLVSAEHSPALTVAFHAQLLAVLILLEQLWVVTTIWSLSLQQLSGLWYHNRTHHPDVFAAQNHRSSKFSSLQCSSCDKTFSSTAAHRRHVKAEHSGNSPFLSQQQHVLTAGREVAVPLTGQVCALCLLANHRKFSVSHSRGKSHLSNLQLSCSWLLLPLPCLQRCSLYLYADVLLKC